MYCDVLIDAFRSLGSGARGNKSGLMPDIANYVVPVP